MTTTIMTDLGKQHIIDQIAEIKNIYIPECLDGIERAKAQCNESDVRYYEEKLSYYQRQVEYWEEALKNTVIAINADELQNTDCLVFGEDGQVKLISA